MPPGRKKKVSKKKEILKENSNVINQSSSNCVTLRVHLNDLNDEDFGLISTNKRSKKFVSKKCSSAKQSLKKKKEKELQEGTSTSDSYDADSEHENISALSNPLNSDKPELSSAPEQSDQFKPTPLLSRFVSNLHSSDHSTPSCDSSTPGTDDSCFGFDTLERQLPFSPVIGDDTTPPLSTLSLGLTSSLTVSLPSNSLAKRSPKSVSISSNPPEVQKKVTLEISEIPIEKPIKKPKKKAAPKKNKDTNAWANEWAEMFKDVEMHNLLVE